MKKIISFWNFERSIEEIYQPKNNAFDLFRFILATLVIVFHSYILSGFQGADFLAIGTHGQTTLGEFAVGGFFSISGFLVTQSLQNSSSHLHFMWKRLLRLFPALFFSLIFSALILGPFTTKMNIYDYFFGEMGPSPIRYIILNITLNIFGFLYNIRDLFYDNPYPFAVNGSLWTLKHEFASYLLLALLSYFSVIRYPKIYLIFTGGVGLSYLASKLLDISLVSKLTSTWWIFHVVEYPFFLEYFLMFLIGSLIYLYKKNIFVNMRLLVLLLFLYISSSWIGYYHYAWLILSPYLIIVAAILLPLPGFSMHGDFSYGIYVYAFPVQQSLMFWFRSFFELQPGRLMIFSFVVTLIISIFSWKIIEAPALKLKSKLFGNRISSFL